MKKMSKGMLMTALICGAVYLGNNPVYANELQEFALDEYVVTAARTETKLVDTPANISVVDAQTIEERHYQDVSEVLKDVPGANVLDNGVGASEKIVRLNGDDRVLVLVDGRRVSTDIGSTSGGRNNMDMNQLPDVSLIERIEVLKGSGGALYGSEAVGGVINIITKKADLNSGKVSVGFGSHGSEDLKAMYSGKSGKTGITVAASKFEQDYYKYRDYKTNSTKRWPGDSDYQNEKISLKLDQELTENTNLTIGYDYSKTDGTNTFDISGNSIGGLDKLTNNLFAKYDWNVGNQNQGFVQIYHNKYEYNNYTLFNEGNFDEKTTGIDLQQEISLGEANKMVIGGSWRKSKVSIQGPYDYSNNYKESIDNLAFFINDTWNFTPSWTLNAGLRYDNHSEAGDETTMSLGLNKRINDDSHIYINWGEVFRAPTTDDLFYNCDGQWPSRGNRDLNPETGETWTIGYSTKVSEKTNVNVNYFESDLDDAITWDYSASPTTVKNLNKQEKKGMELTLNHSFNDRLDLVASYTYLKVENSNNGSDFQRDKNAIPNIYRLGIRYHDEKWNIDTFLRYGTGADTSTTENGYNMFNYQYDAVVGKYIDSCYLTVDMAITYKADENWSFYAKGYNLFNEAYAEQGGTTNGVYNYPAQSRRFIVGAEYKF